jgi:hypothetical protein
MTNSTDTGIDHVLLEDVFFFAPPDPFNTPARVLAPAQIPLAEPCEEQGFLAGEAFSVETADIPKPVDSADVFGPTIAAIVKSTAR